MHAPTGIHRVAMSSELSDLNKSQPKGNRVVDTGTWNALDNDAKSEFHSLFDRFQSALRESGINDGYDLGMDWAVVEVDGEFKISNGKVHLDGVSSKRKKVIDALYTDGVQNLNR